MPLELNFKQELTGCFGKPVAENPTQAMVEAAYRHHGLNWRYLTIEVSPENLPAAVQGARAMGFVGFNCTIPHKVAVIPHLDRLGESAMVIGAVNCVVIRDGALIGENTDGKGFVQSLREIADPRGMRVTILGAGGAARAIAVELVLAGAKSIRLLNRSEERGRSLQKLLQERLKVDAPLETCSSLPLMGTDSGSDFLVRESDLFVNATSIGLYPEVDAQVPVDVSKFPKSMIVADVIPNPPRTRLIREAEAQGCRVIDGLGMLVNQGVIGIEYWSGLHADPLVMRQALEVIFNPDDSSSESVSV